MVILLFEKRQYTMVKRFNYFCLLAGSETGKGLACCPLRSHFILTRMDLYGFKISPILRNVGTSRKSWARLSGLIDNCACCAVHPDERPNFNDNDRDDPPTDFVHGN